MSTFRLIFPSQEQVDKYQKIFSLVEYNEVRDIYEPTEDVVKTAWEEIVTAAKAETQRRADALP
jgi:hypothetical protein